MGLDAIVTMLKSDTRTRILSSPVIVTTDNTEAVLSSSQQKYFLKGSTVDQFGNVRPETEIKDIGLDLKVTPHINERGAVMMEITQSLSDEGAPQVIAELGEFPTTQTRNFEASITVQDRETIVLGGLVRNSRVKTRTGVPIVGSIPLVGRLFRSDSSSVARSEVVVFITPYVVDTPDDISGESARRKEALNVQGLWPSEWSGSKLGKPTPGEDEETWPESRREPVSRRLPSLIEALPFGRSDAGEEEGPTAEDTTGAAEPVAEPPAEPAAKPPAAAVAPPEVEPPAPEAPPAVALPDGPDPFKELDPELVDYIRGAEKRWNRALERVDTRVERDHPVDGRPESSE